MSTFTVIVGDNPGKVYLVHVLAATSQVAMAVAAKIRGEAFFVFGGHPRPIEVAQ